MHRRAAGGTEGIYELLGMRPHRESAAAAAANFASSVSTKVPQLGLTVHRSAQRSQALAAIGWPRDVAKSLGLGAVDQQVERYVKKVVVVVETA